MKTQEIQGLIWLVRNERIIAGPFISYLQAKAAAARLQEV
jgi:hypothetical protein